MYKITDNFLKMFGYGNLDELPKLPKYKIDENKQIVIDELVPDEIINSEQLNSEEIDNKQITIEEVEQVKNEIIQKTEGSKNDEK